MELASRFLRSRQALTSEKAAAAPESGAARITSRPFIVFTGGPGGGKSSLIEELRADPAWNGRFVALPETVEVARFLNVSPGEKLFQRVMVNLQMALEDGLDRGLDRDDPRAVICHRGTLDPLSFWLVRDWPRDEFFDYVGLTLQEHYRRYHLVLHLVTSADGVPERYTRWPASHRPEDAQQAMDLDRLLGDIWNKHPKYYRIDNRNRDWPAKAAEAKAVLMREWAGQ